jgi:hypothetical protein
VDERRKTVRRKALKGARIIFNDGASSFSCAVRDISDEGAKLSIDDTAHVPDFFLLMFDDERPSQQCSVKWRSARTLGVQFGK